MDGDRCHRQGCTGFIQDGYCDICGLAAVRTAAVNGASSATASAGPPASNSTSSITTGTGSSPMSRSGRGTRRSNHSSRSTGKQLGAGLLSLPDLPSTEPEKAILADPKVPEHKRFCPGCNQPLRRETGFCGKCGHKYSFLPTLNPGDIVANQYEVKGAIAYGGLGWIYLGFDKILSRYVVLKGLLNVHDESSAAAAVAERQFLAAVKHPNIVSIYNFVQNGPEGFIVMEYVGGKTVKQIRQERGPLPPAEAIAYIHRILSAFSYLHQQGLVYCDFKPDNVMLEKDDVKLIDMGGVRRLDDKKGDVYGTVGYSAPEAGDGPTVASDLFTIGRALTVLLINFPGYSSEFRYTLPSPQDQPLFAEQESLYRFLLKATAQNPDDRFVSADEMSEHLLGVMREIVARDTNNPRPTSSIYFGPDLLSLHSASDLKAPVEPDPTLLPMPLVDTSDPAAQLIMGASGLLNVHNRIAALASIVQRIPKSREARLRLVGALAQNHQFEEVNSLLAALEQEDPWDWRVLWMRGWSALLRRQPAEARKSFDQVYFDLPGELAPKLAMGLAAELGGDRQLAIHMYEIVSRTDPSYVSAIFGLARCLHATGKRREAVDALDRLPPQSSLYARARVEAARVLIGINGTGPAATELAEASSMVESLGLEGMSRFVMKRQILSAALTMLTSKSIQPSPTTKILGQTLDEAKLRSELEKTLRGMARMVDGEERVRLIDEANRVRPRTLF